MIWTQSRGMASKNPWGKMTKLYVVGDLHVHVHPSLFDEIEETIFSWSYVYVKMAKIFYIKSHFFC